MGSCHAFSGALAYAVLGELELTLREDWVLVSGGGAALPISSPAEGGQWWVLSDGTLAVAGDGQWDLHRYNAGEDNFTSASLGWEGLGVSNTSKLDVWGDVLGDSKKAKTL